jgi:hypothetical protein
VNTLARSDEDCVARVLAVAANRELARHLGDAPEVLELLRTADRLALPLRGSSVKAWQAL